LDSDENPIGAPDYSAVSTNNADVNSTVTIPLYIDNDGDSQNSFQLSAGSVFDAATNTVGGLPAGWSVEFFLADDAGQPIMMPMVSMKCWMEMVIRMVIIRCFSKLYLPALVPAM